MDEKGLAYVHHIADAISSIEEYIGEFTEQEFYEKKLVQDAVIRNLEIIGEPEVGALGSCEKSPRCHKKSAWYNRMEKDLWYAGYPHTRLSWR